MSSLIVSPLIPRPIPVNTGTLTGELRVDGNIEHNAIQFRFRFTDPCEIAPLLLIVNAAGKTCRYYCTIQDNNAREMVTPIFHPEFNVGQCFTITKIEPLVQFFPS
jgi:hypothetical protein